MIGFQTWCIDHKVLTIYSWSINFTDTTNGTILIIQVQMQNDITNYDVQACFNSRINGNDTRL